MNFNFTGKIRAGYLTAFILLLISYGLTFYTNHQLAVEHKFVDDTNRIINSLELMGSSLKDAETGYRGYMMMKDEKFMDHYYPSHHIVDSTYALLSRLEEDNPTQLERLIIIGRQIDEKYSIINQSIEQFKQNDFQFSDSMRSLIYRGRTVMDSIRFNVGLMQHRANEQLQIKTDKVRLAAATIRFINLASLIIAILVASYSVIAFSSENKAKTEAARQAEEYRGKLEERVGDLKKMNQELVALRSMEKFTTTGRLARTIAHEIRNPLTNIGLATDQLKGEIVENEDTSMLLDMINRNGTRINQLITELLNSTKFSELNYTPVSINDILDQSLSLAGDRIQLKKITVKKKYSKDLLDVSADQEKLKIAFLNIIVNAIEAMPDERGELSLRTDREDNKCMIVISDNGSGMDPEMMSKLFEPYFTSKAKGNGLGLTNTQNIILNHKGSIEVESEPGKGTSFIIYLNMQDSTQANAV